MINKKTQIISFLLSIVLLFGLFPTTASAAYGIRAQDNPFGHTVTAMKRSMHDYTAKRPGLSGDKDNWVYGKDYVYH